MTKRKASEDWEKWLGDAIENSEKDADELNRIMVKIDAFKTKTFNCLIKLKQSVGCGVIMTKSNENQDHDTGYNMCSRSVNASFTAGPNTAPFSINFENENVEGDDNIKVESELFTFEDGEFSDVADDKIDEFLESAGLIDATPKNNDSKTFTIEERRRWVFAEMIDEAIVLVLDEYGSTDSCGVGLGMNEEDIYGHLGLDY
mmetsp:Transcript_3741/g.3895  ORF Transcript_3741/g.3895 Transcript_3741/m.3895 type:complete len:202 (+) Transcript_3741:92-697(+)|eukprot:CAMPEP_0119044088 /NCGR_PEP_ID=MMETSP1177-20130426/28450_1 /TAXON_ID=2985 /ORGANISM="Ochromonas sp, Strain CCMP1899" /LENGTH=201 /DNA_ID=CAMNT_0007013547 /DNA_START=41 /DNA_END=646 /DNA_ORIENTATION=+